MKIVSKRKFTQMPADAQLVLDIVADLESKVTSSWSPTFAGTFFTGVMEGLKSHGVIRDNVVAYSTASHLLDISFNFDAAPNEWYLAVVKLA